MPVTAAGPPVGTARPLPRRARLLRGVAALLSVVLALVLGACREPEDVPPTPLNTELEVTGSAGAPPALVYDEPLDVPETRTEVVWPGTGRVLEDDGPLLLNLYAEDAAAGTVLQNTYADAPQWLRLTDESVGTELADLLRGQRVGARLLLVEEDDGVPVVLVADVLPTRADGEVVAPPDADGVPTVELAEDGAPTITVPADTPPPTDLGVRTLVRGSGAQVEAGQVVTVRYTGVRWSDGAVVDSSWADDAAPSSVMIGIGEVVEGWEQGLLEQSVGSQVLLVVPPELGYEGTANPLAEETLVYVVDVLDAHFPVSAEEAAGGADDAAPDQTGDAPADEGENP
ncbi:FKBP-type peptidyl-prolyl cis-trans isomerase [Cellulosimicrobium marinum]|uniref:FKBP-type peptidyl-prolyl cis-trans isomerase n=1 Tax=Cellulosimicrobium marinum TaxID=1638992 RepID=UPI001E4A87D2|nr:FKBP-type peptidyl-prolyl cis-trans isomerase [Cellulosimicrobium marinum]MCB7137359.1 FKBP-type peptidyl-prolyl cis-trans isomerase [Cellulosimicrobium marinum]